MLFLTLLAALYSVLTIATPTVPWNQRPLVELDKTEHKVAGNQNATYGPVPIEDQLFKLQFLDIAPFPILTNQYFFALFRGWLSDKEHSEVYLQNGFTNATINVTIAYTDSDGNPRGSNGFIIPLQTEVYSDLGHLSIRDYNGVYVNYLPSSGRSDILAEFLLLEAFLETGMHTFEVVARAGDNEDSCLFAITYSQWFTSR